MPTQLRETNVGDIDAIVALSEQKRRQYQTYQPLFWRKAADSAAKQTPFLTNQITQDHILALVHITDQEIDGFVIANIGRGKKCAIDDFALADESHWHDVGKTLLLEISRRAQSSGMETIEVVCGHLDQPKRAMLQSAGLVAERYWYTSAIEPVEPLSTAQCGQSYVRESEAEDAPLLAKLLGRDDGQVPEINNERMNIVIARMNGEPAGASISLIVPTPPVYDPGGDTCLVTELAIKESASVDHDLSESRNRNGHNDAIKILDSPAKQVNKSLKLETFRVNSMWT